MSLRLPRRQYADLFGPTVGDRVRLADTELLIEIERDFMQRILASAPIELPMIIADASIDESTRQRTHEANLRRVVREKFGLPRLTLFR